MPRRLTILTSIVAIVFVLCSFTVSYADVELLDDAIKSAAMQQKPLLIEFVHDD